MLDQEKFFNTYKVQEAFEDSGLSWDTLERIYEDYTRRLPEMKKIADRLQDEISKVIDFHVHSIHNINERNYMRIVRDLMGIRILILSKEEWRTVHDFLLKVDEDSRYDMHMAEMPRAYIRYGDRDIFNYTIHKEYTDKGYRSQHYIFKYGNYYFEVQVRTIAEEVYAEFDHYVKYPYRENNHFLKRYTSVVAELLNSVDEIISTCFQFGEAGWLDIEKYFAQDSYSDLQRMSKEPHKREQEQIPRANDGVIDAQSYMNRTILRKG